MLIDSHAHLDMDQFEGDRDQVLDRAVKEGITRIITIGINLSSSLRALELAGRYEFLFSTVGCHPHHALELDSRTLDALAALVSSPKVVAWGEIGLDFFKRRSPVNRQIEAFERQVDAAIDRGLPIVIHDREAHREVYEILKKRGGGRHGGVIHCFSGDYDLAMAFIDMGFHISIPGTVTYKNALALQDVASRIPIERILIETDAPFLAPVPKRGKRNEPCFVKFTAEKVAGLRGMDTEALALKTAENANRLFRLPDPGGER